MPTTNQPHSGQSQSAQDKNKDRNKAKSNDLNQDEDQDQEDRERLLESSSDDTVIDDSGLIRTRQDQSPSQERGRSQESRNDRGVAARNAKEPSDSAGKGVQGEGKQNNAGNFANDRNKASEAGRKSGEAKGNGN